VGFWLAAFVILGIKQGKKYGENRTSLGKVG